MLLLVVWFGFFVFGLGFLCLVFCDNVGIMVTLTIWAKRLFIENTYDVRFNEETESFH